MGLEIVGKILKIVVKRKVVNEEFIIMSIEVLDVLVVKLDFEKVVGFLLILEIGFVQLFDLVNMKQVLVGVGDFVDIEVFLYDVVFEYFIGIFSQFVYIELFVLLYFGEV